MISPRRITTWVLAVFAIAAPAASQETPRSCDTPHGHRFDFWAGTWDVRSSRVGTDGAWHDTENVWHAQRMANGCAFSDWMEGVFGDRWERGIGSRFYDPASDRWTITWLSSQAPQQVGAWIGGFEGERAEFLQSVETPNGDVLSRISWWDLSDDSAEWEHAVSRDGGETWQATWRMSFRRRR